MEIQVQKSTATTERALAELSRIVELFSSEKSQELVGICAKAMIDRTPKPSINWSLGNQISMLLQGTADARGYQQWLEVNRFVRKGCHAIYILGPVKRKIRVEDEETHELKEIYVIRGFKGLPVFRIEDTDVLPGREDKLKPYVPLDPPPLLEVAQKYGFSIVYERLRCAYGSAEYAGKSIILSSEEWHVFFHELFHVVYNTFWPKEQCGEEPEREAAAALGAATLGRIYGRPDDKFAFNYIAYFSESKTPEGVGRMCLRVLAKVQQVVRTILNDYDGASEDDSTSGKLNE